MRALQEQIARLANMMVQPAQGALQQQQQQQGQQARASAAVGAQPQEEEPHEEDEEDARSHVSAGSSASSAMRQRVTVERATRKIEQPKPLLYDKAGDSGALETWIDEMEMLFVRIGVEDDEAAKLAEIQQAADRDVRQWWKDQRLQAVRDGAPIDTWVRFLEILRAQFLPQLEAHKATSELINIRQEPGEPMEKYFLRATRLYGRINGAFPDSAAMNIVLDRVRKEEWRFAVAVATREVQAGRVTTMAQLRALLQREALAEPNRPQRPSGGGGGSSSAQSKPQNSRNGQRKQTVRAAAIGQEDGDSGEEDGPSSSVRAAPVQQRAASTGGRGAYAGTCSKCLKKGHKAAECRGPEERTCFICGTKGHIATACAQHYKNKGAAAGAGSGGAQPKNE